jgi:hypothetical protein
MGRREQSVSGLFPWLRSGSAFWRPEGPCLVLGSPRLLGVQAGQAGFRLGRGSRLLCWPEDLGPPSGESWPFSARFSSHPNQGLLAGVKKLQPVLRRLTPVCGQGLTFRSRGDVCLALPRRREPAEAGF